MALTPADRGWEVQALVDRIAALERRTDRLEWAHRMNAQRAEVYSYTSGAMCIVEFEATGTRAPVGFPYPFYTPAPGHGGYVLDTGVGLVFLPVSTF